VSDPVSDSFLDALAATRTSDGGFGPRAGLPSEPESTALAALALDDQEARAWLAAHQRADGSLARSLGSVTNEASTALAALALDGDAGRGAANAIAATRAGHLESSSALPFDDDLRGWPWTAGAFGWVEPTAWAVLALRVVLPGTTDAIEEGVGMLRDRECVGGGWNYGNRIVLDEELPPFGQPTAMAMLALQAFEDDEVWRRGMAALRGLWRQEAAGGLTLAVATAALRVNHDYDATACAAALADNFDRTRFLGDIVALAWAAIATGTGLGRLMINDP